MPQLIPTRVLRKSSPNSTVKHNLRTLCVSCFVLPSDASTYLINKYLTDMQQIILKIHSAMYRRDGIF